MFNKTPCYMGFPNQLYVSSKFAFDSFERTFKNKVPFFVSTFQYTKKEFPIVDNLYFDIDSYFSLRFPYRNIKRLRDYLYSKDYPYVINFSGGKGFHLYLLLKPMQPKSESSKERVRDLMYSVQMRIAKDIGIEAFDEPTFGRIRFLTRFPTSKYIRGNEETGAYEESGFYCRNLTDAEFDSGLKKICKIAMEPGIVPKPAKSDITLQSIADSFKDFKLLHREDGKIERIKMERTGSNVPTISAIGVPCLQDIVTHSHPTHYERIELVSFLKFLGYTDLAICAFIKNQNWTRYNYAKTSMQVRTINARYPKCTFLRKTYGEFCKDCTLRNGR